MPARVVHLKKEPYDIRIDRTTKWGNPFVVNKDGTRKEVIAKYRIWLRTQPLLLKDIHELEGKVLGCWCKPKPCHGDVLAELANDREQVRAFLLSIGEGARTTPGVLE